MIARALRSLRIKAGLSREDLAAQCGLSRDAIASYETGRRKPDFDAIVKLEKVLKTTASALADDKFKPDIASYTIGSLLADKYKSLIALFINANKQAQETVWIILEKGQKKKGATVPDENQPSENWFFISIPVVGRAAAGLPIEMIEEKGENISIDNSHIQYGDFAVVADGDSMVDAGIHNGDRIIVRPQPAVENGEIALIAIDDGSTIKRFYLTDDGYKLIPANKEYKEQFYPREANIRILGKVIKSIGQ